MNSIDPRSIEWLPLASLTADPRNPKAHDQATIDASISRFGVLDLIVRDERTGHIISGHGRHKALAAMMEREEKPPDGVKLDEQGQWLVPVVTGWSSRSDTEAAAALIALNRTTELGGWVDDALLTLLDELGNQENGLVGVGFDTSDLDDLRKYLAKQEPADLDGLAEQWDESQGLAPRTEETVIVISDPELAAEWQEHRKGFSSDDSALRSLLPES